MIQQYPNAYGHPETALRLDHTAGDPTLHVENCPIGMAITGPKCQVKVGLTCYDVTDMGDYPYLDWVVVPGTEDTEDADYIAGTAVYVPITRGGMEDIRARTYVTIDDEVASNPHSKPLADINLNQVGTRNHSDLMNVDPNQHHNRLHRHDTAADGVNLFPTSVYIGQQLRLQGIATIPQITGNVNNFGPVEGIGYNVWLLSSDAARDITGLALGTGLTGRYLILINVGAFAITLKHNNSGSTFANRFKISGAADRVLGADSGIAQGLWAGTTGLEQWRIW